MPGVTAKTPMCSKMATLISVFRRRALDSDERNDLHDQIQHRHAEEYTADPVNEYVYLCVQRYLIQLLFYVVGNRQAVVSSRNEFSYSIEAESGVRCRRISIQCRAVRLATILRTPQQSHPCIYVARRRDSNSLNDRPGRQSSSISKILNYNVIMESGSSIVSIPLREYQWPPRLGLHPCAAD